MENNNKSKTPFHKTTKGKVFIVIMTLVVLGLLGFGGMVSYYTYQLKYGDAETKKQLIKQFNEDQFTQVRSEGIEKEEVNNMKDIIRDHNPTAGAEDAKVTVVAFLDFECPFCQKQYSILSNVISKYGPAVKVVFKHFPLTSLHPHAKIASLASTCAQEQDKFWSYYDELFKRQQFNRSAFIKIAQDLDLNTEQFKSCYDSQKYIDRVEQDLADGINIGARGTPTFIINGQKVEGVIKKEQWNELILNEINKE